MRFKKEGEIALICRAEDLQTGGSFSASCGNDISNINKILGKWDKTLSPLSEIWIEGSDGTRFASEYAAILWLARHWQESGSNLSQNRACKSRLDAAINRKKAGKCCTPQRAVDWVVAVHLRGRPFTKRETDILLALKNALKSTRQEPLTYWSKIQQALMDLGCPYTGRAGKREGFNSLCAFISKHR